MGSDAGGTGQHLGPGKGAAVPHLGRQTPDARGDDDLHIVVPVYNEGDNFPRFYESLKANVRIPYRLLVIYDREDDTTLPVARRLAETDRSLSLVRNFKPGVLGALKTGLSAPTAGAVVVTMADGSDQHERIDEMYALYRQGYDVVCASRYSKGGMQRGGPRLKGLLSRFAGLSLRVLTRLPTSDPTNNFKLYSHRFLSRVKIESRGGFEVALELTVKAHQGGFRITELPTIWTDRTLGKSNFKLVRWLPLYLHWYAEAVRGRFRRGEAKCSTR